MLAFSLIMLNTDAHSAQIEHKMSLQQFLRNNQDIDEGSDKSVAEQLRDALSKHAIKVMDLFREWDENGDGNVSKKEFRRAMGLLGFDVPKTEIDALFDAFDPDGSGAMEFKELQKMLRHAAPAADPKAVVSARRASVAAGGRGKGKK